MRLTVFNGSPRGKGSNTQVLLGHFTSGFMEKEGNTCETAYLVRTSEREELIKLFQEAEHVLMAFPLYTDAMPALVKTFIESLEPLCGRTGNPDIGFIVQSGFPEPNHSRYVERYLKKLTRRLGCEYKGTAIRGGVEGIRATPDRMNQKLFKAFHALGTSYGERGEFDQRIVSGLARPERLNGFSFRIARWMTHKLYWDKELKKNHAFEKRFARPFNF
ncbi:MAG: NAD(P)H-dependent oxidoreductase [Dehalococcoidales bacterium]|nr:NAD(P)H-dependent oxidoreductase [Dehalococcoidales bacterium]